MSTPTAPVAFQLHLPDRGETLAVPAGATLLQSLLGAGVVWPASCRNGTCRACIGQLVSGTVRYSVAWPGLLPEEKAQGCVLPCVACPTSDVVLTPPVD
ncbi:MAG: 2Fe-2S iron-sulfur cluster binding domain-containing protein [Hydrogenophaga sp.]|uniref:2Fe-2S iron-sulfur cluster-binding protein n=1 Tax=Hydrogenophaga sp. TaxID=1904254 RepID=UPI0025C0462B|nr:2Fe-2S iron-sulfur cluster binding domain-containing protein [Hydrogenophaga sp.]MBT9550510.1 2Fe-2S iron-sulfur cluster binding domain-containing protein [Hydrogenophaga sp.]